MNICSTEWFSCTMRSSGTCGTFSTKIGSIETFWLYCFFICMYVLQGDCMPKAATAPSQAHVKNISAYISIYTYNIQILSKLNYLFHTPQTDKFMIWRRKIHTGSASVCLHNLRDLWGEDFRKRLQGRGGVNFLRHFAKISTNEKKGFVM